MMSHLEKGSLQIDYLKVLKMRPSWLIQVGPEPNNRYLIRDRYRGEGDRNMEAETEVMQLQPSASGETGLDLRLLVSRTVRE